MTVTLIPCKWNETLYLNDDAMGTLLRDCV